MNIVSVFKDKSESELFYKLSDIPIIHYQKPVNVHLFVDGSGHCAIRGSKSYATLSACIRRKGFTVQQYLDKYSEKDGKSYKSLKELPTEELLLDAHYHRFIYDGSLIKFDSTFRSRLIKKLKQVGSSLHEYVVFMLNDIDHYGGDDLGSCLICKNEPRVLGNKKGKYFSRVSLNEDIYLLPYCEKCSGRWKRIKSLFTANTVPNLVKNGFKSSIINGLNCQGSFEEHFVKNTSYDLIDGPKVNYSFKGKQHVYHCDFFIESINCPVEVKSKFYMMKYFEINVEKFNVLMFKYGKVLIVLDKKEYLIESDQDLIIFMVKLYFEYFKDKRLGIIGSRDYNLGLTGLDILFNIMNIEPSLIVSGHGGKSDLSGEYYSDLCGIDTLIFPADWKKYGKRAGFMRNTDIADNSDIILSLWDGESRGTLDTMKKMKLSGKSVIYFNFKTKKLKFY